MCSSITLGQKCKLRTRAQPSRLSVDLNREHTILHFGIALEPSDADSRKFIFEVMTEREDMGRYLKDLCDLLWTFFSRLES